MAGSSKTQRKMKRSLSRAVVPRWRRLEEVADEAEASEVIVAVGAKIVAGTTGVKAMMTADPGLTTVMDPKRATQESKTSMKKRRKISLKTRSLLNRKTIKTSKSFSGRRRSSLR